MGLLLLAIGLCLPRVVLVFLWATGDYIGRAYETNVYPFLGFLALPATTLAYAYVINTNGSVSGWYTLVLLVGFLVDLGSGERVGQRGRRRSERDEE